MCIRDSGCFDPNKGCSECCQAAGSHGDDGPGDPRLLIRSLPTPGLHKDQPGKSFSATANPHSREQASVDQNRQEPSGNAIPTPIPHTMALAHANTFPTGEGLQNEGAIHGFKCILAVDAFQPLAGRSNQRNAAVKARACCRSGVPVERDHTKP